MVFSNIVHKFIENYAVFTSNRYYLTVFHTVSTKKDTRNGCLFNLGNLLGFGAFCRGFRRSGTRLRRGAPYRCRLARRRRRALCRCRRTRRRRRALCRCRRTRRRRRALCRCRLARRRCGTRRGYARRGRSRLHGFCFCGLRFGLRGTRIAVFRLWRRRFTACAAVLFMTEIQP